MNTLTRLIIIHAIVPPTTKSFKQAQEELAATGTALLPPYSIYDYGKRILFPEYIRITNTGDLEETNRMILEAFQHADTISALCTPKGAPSTWRYSVETGTTCPSGTELHAPQTWVELGNMMHYGLGLEETTYNVAISTMPWDPTKIPKCITEEGECLPPIRRLAMQVTQYGGLFCYTCKSRKLSICTRYRNITIQVLSLYEM